MNRVDVIIIGAGAAGLMCAIEAGKRGRQVLLLDHANKPGKKILMSGGGRCNFTNIYASPDNFISHNPHFCKSALSRYTQWDFMELVKKHRIAFHEKTLGQLFCDNKSKDIVSMLLREAEQVGVKIMLNTNIKKLACEGKNNFLLLTSHGKYQCESVVIASGGLSIPTMGATGFGYEIAKQFGIKVWPTRAGLVPFTWRAQDKAKYESLSGIAVDCVAENDRANFKEAMLFTHRGLSGPAILQISSYWQNGEKVKLKMLPELDLFEHLKTMQKKHVKKSLRSILNELFPKRLVEVFVKEALLLKPLAEISHVQFQEIADTLQAWQTAPNGTEGYRTAEVTLGGVDCNALSSKTMQASAVPGLYFIGEVVDVTGWLGGYNFQWAWSSAVACGQHC
jgi:hypothetical protein